VLLVPTFWALDWFVVPEQVWLTLWIRLIPPPVGLGHHAREPHLARLDERHVQPLSPSSSR
jgi:hypothetical protein